MKKLLLAVALILLLASVFTGTRQYREMTAHSCGQPIATTKSAHWIWQWLPNRDDNKDFIQCAGPSSFISYRPLDVAGVGFVISGSLVIIAIRRR